MRWISERPEWIRKSWLGGSLHRALQGAAIAGLAAAVLALAVPTAMGQMTLSPTPQKRNEPNLLTNPGASPGVQQLYKLDEKFSDAVAKGGGKAFASWFAPDGVTLANGKAPVEGRAAIADVATWAPEAYQLTWKTAGARMSPEGNSGFTWGEYTGLRHRPDGSVSQTTGRYMRVWQKQKDGKWKVALDASNTGPVEDDCCSLP